MLSRDYNFIILLGPVTTVCRLLYGVPMHRSFLECFTLPIGEVYYRNSLDPYSKPQRLPTANLSDSSFLRRESCYHKANFYLDLLVERVHVQYNL